MNSSKVFLRVNRVEAALCAQALEATVSDLHEAAWLKGHGGLMSSRMRPLQKGRKIAGPAVTAFCAPGDNLMMHRALYLAQPGYGSSYLGGKALFESLLAESARAAGPGFRLRGFMDEMNASGMIPISLIREELRSRATTAP